MQRMTDRLKEALSLAALIAFAVALAWLLQTAGEGVEAGQELSPVKTPALASPTVPSWPLPPTPFPPDYTPAYPDGTLPTATPYPGEIRPPSVFTTHTPRPISKTTDLAPDLPDEEKSVYVIRRSDGTYEKFLISSHYAGDVKELLELELGDVLISHHPLKPRPSKLILTKPTSETPSLSRRRNDGTGGGRRFGP